MRRIRFAVTLFLLFVPIIALGSEGAHHEEHHGGVPWATLVFSTINLSLIHI